MLLLRIFSRRRESHMGQIVSVGSNQHQGMSSLPPSLHRGPRVCHTANRRTFSPRSRKPPEHDSHGFVFGDYLPYMLALYLSPNRSQCTGIWRISPIVVGAVGASSL